MIPIDVSAVAARLTTLVEEGLAQRFFTAASLLWGGASGDHWENHVGFLRPPRSLPASAESIFDLASLTKPVATASSVLLLAQRKVLNLRHPLARYLPLVARSPLCDLTPAQLLTHTSGLPAWRAFYKTHHGRKSVLSAVRRESLEAPPNAQYRYSDLGFMLLGALVEQAGGMSLSKFAQQNLFAPLGMKDTRFRPPPSLRSRIVPTEFCKARRRRARGEAHDENCWAMGGVCGHAGLFSTARDLARFCRALLQGEPLFTPATLRLLRTNQIAALGAGSSLGWFTPPNPMLPALESMPPTAFGHSGFTGTAIVVLPERGEFLIVLTNRVYFGRNTPDFYKWRREVYRAFALAQPPANAASVSSER